MLPRWTNGGRELVYRNGARFMAVDVAPRAQFSPGKPHLLFEADTLRIYDVTPDGQRFVMIKTTAEPEVRDLSVVFNWLEELKRTREVIRRHHRKHRDHSLAARET